MTIIADSGSTKADWVLLTSAEAQPEIIQTMGFNPIYHPSELIQQKVQTAFLEALAPVEEVNQIFYYGTAIWDPEKAKVVEIALANVFPNATIEVKHDLLGAARATCGTKPGISCILGTGSNTCYYDGQEVVDNVTNLGYFLGDEGSGAHLGKALVQTYFYRELPADLKAALEKLVPGGKSEFLSNIYGENTSPNVYLASLTRFIATHKSHFFMQGLIYRSFAEFIDRHVRKYPKHLSIPIHFIGSVAFYFQEELNFILEERGMRSGVFIKKPIDNLVEFHRPVA